MEIQEWLNSLVQALQVVFGERLLFVGLQGSYSREEATETSDIDVVVILEDLMIADLKTYDSILAGLPHREKVCGFVSGRRELSGWDRSDLFQFYRDTTPVFGELEPLLPEIQMEDVRRAVHLGACNLYHGCIHNFLHEKSAELLEGLYKSAVFTVQAKYFCETHQYLKRREQLLAVLNGEDREIVHTAVLLKGAKDEQKLNLEALSEWLLSWASRVMLEYEQRDNH